MSASQAGKFQVRRGVSVVRLPCSKNKAPAFEANAQKFCAPSATFLSDHPVRMTVLSGPSSFPKKPSTPECGVPGDGDGRFRVLPGRVIRLNLGLQRRILDAAQITRLKERWLPPRRSGAPEVRYRRRAASTAWWLDRAASRLRRRFTCETRATSSAQSSAFVKTVLLAFFRAELKAAASRSWAGRPVVLPNVSLEYPPGPFQ
jgi:hypothetical protein